MKRISHKPLPLCSNSTAQEQPPDTQTRQSVTDVNNELPSTMFPSYRLGSPSQVVYRQSRQPVEHGYQEFAGMKLPSYGSGSHSEILPGEAPGITFPSYGFGVQSNASPSAPSFLANQTTAFRSLSRYSETEISNTASVNVAADKELDILQRRSPSPQMRKLGDTLFQYKPLDSTQSQIRLLRVLPGFYTSYIQCEVFEASLASPRPYIALSYCWGDTEDTRTIGLNGYDFAVTESLWSALFNFRSITHAVILWVDAVCIDQLNVDERNVQVQAMTRIYNQAYEVAVWLGSEAEESSSALNFLREINTLNIMPSRDQKLRETFKDPGRLSQLQAVVCLFERDYWNRLWVVQEVHSAKKIKVHCGSTSLPWTYFTTSSSLFRLHLNNLATLMQEKVSATGYTWATILSNHGPARLWDMREDSPTKLLPYLIFHRSKACADARDKVFGLLGVLSLHERSQIIVDYSMSIREVYTNVVEYVLRTTRRLDVICASIHFPWHQSPKALPTWVPDWSQTSAQPPISYLFPRKFTASCAKDVNYSYSHHRRRLQITAIPIDEIHHCGTHLSPPRSLNTILIVMFQWRLKLLEFVGRGPNSISAHEAFCRTLCFDRDQHKISPRELLDWTYHTFANLLQERYHHLELDEQLKFYAKIRTPDNAHFQNLIFEDYFADAMTGRRFLLTSNGLFGLGTGAARSGDIVCVPLGCSTPVILRKVGDGYRYVGDVYIDGYMYGKAIEEMERGVLNRQPRSFLLI